MKPWPLVGLLVVAASCGRTVTEDDCTRIKDNMRAAWDAEAKKATPADATGAEIAAAVVKAEGEKLGDDWMAECKKELMGKRVEPKEMDCLLSSKTLEKIKKCSEP